MRKMFLFGASLGLAVAAPAADKVDSLPGFKPTAFDVYSGGHPY